MEEIETDLALEELDAALPEAPITVPVAKAGAKAIGSGTREANPTAGEGEDTERVLTKDGRDAATESLVFRAIPWSCCLKL